MTSVTFCPSSSSSSSSGTSFFFLHFVVPYPSASSAFGLAGARKKNSNSSFFCVPFYFGKENQRILTRGIIYRKLEKYLWTSSASYARQMHIFCSSASEKKIETFLDRMRGFCFYFCAEKLP